MAPAAPTWRSSSSSCSSSRCRWPPTSQAGTARTPRARTARWLRCRISMGRCDRSRVTRTPSAPGSRITSASARRSSAGTASRASSGSACRPRPPSSRGVTAGCSTQTMAGWTITRARSCCSDDGDRGRGARRWCARATGCARAASRTCSRSRRTSTSSIPRSCRRRSAA